MSVNLPTFTCLRCGHQWIPRKQGTPVRCGGCKSPYWNRPKNDDEPPVRSEAKARGRIVRGRNQKE